MHSKKHYTWLVNHELLATVHLSHCFLRSNLKIRVMVLRPVLIIRLLKFTQHQRCDIATCCCCGSSLQKQPENKLTFATMLLSSTINSGAFDRIFYTFWRNCTVAKSIICYAKEDWRVWMPKVYKHEFSFLDAFILGHPEFFSDLLSFLAHIILHIKNTSPTPSSLNKT